MTAINGFVAAVNNVLYQPYIVPLLLVVAGIYFTIRTKGMQVRLFGEMFRVIKEKPKTDNGVSSFGALMVSTASRVGTGNIIGVSTAICTGGPGAIFWMWITAILGGASAFIESTLAQIYKKKDVDGTSYGGPSFYMRDALGQRWLGVIFAILIIFTYAVGYNMLAAYNLQSTFQAFSFYNDKTPYIIGAILAILFGAIVIGGAKRLIKVTEYLVPLMGVIYIADQSSYSSSMLNISEQCSRTSSQAHLTSSQSSEVLQDRALCGVLREDSTPMRLVWVLLLMQLQELMYPTRLSRVSYRRCRYSSIHCSSARQPHLCACRQSALNLQLRWQELLMYSHVCRHHLEDSDQSSFRLLCHCLRSQRLSETIHTAKAA